MTRVPYLDLKAQYSAIRAEVLAALEAVCESTRFAQGPPTADFEREFAAYCGVNHCVTLNSGTSALHLAMRCLNVDRGEEVITTPFTFIATAWAISYTGARPVFVDVDPARRTIDPGQIESGLGPRTRAVIPVHLFGQPANMAPILAIAARQGLSVVEDAAQAHGARYQGRRVGQFGDMACFSFYPGKNLGAYGEGGALVTNSERFAARARALRDHAQTQRYFHDEVGYNYRMDSFQAAVLSVKLRHLEAWNGARAQKARRYAQLLAGLPCQIPAEFPDSECVWHCYVIETERRDEVRAHLAQAGIETGLHYPLPLHLQKAYASLGYRRGDFPVAERLSERCLSLPLYPELTDEQQQYVAATLKAALQP
jgi:dTDP-4-amino-4,6-dideoxygalactose transaminase